MLWDDFPSGRVPGGAPLNIASNLIQLGLQPMLVSAVGQDAAGEELLNLLRQRQIPETWIQQNRLSTSRVQVDDSQPEEVRYEILFPVAWDRIAWNEALREAAEQADMVIFGSLSLRHPQSLATLRQLLAHTSAQVIFDLNLRPPFLHFPDVEDFLHRAQLLKVNEEELLFLTRYLLGNASASATTETLVAAAAALCQRYQLAGIWLTRGGEGAYWLAPDRAPLAQKAYPVQVKDTVGAGDAFLSGMVAGLAAEKSAAEILDFAARLGAFVASQSGGAPLHDPAAIAALKY
ncbi:PfkB domain-containing protein [Nitritalea halalkaliphila LW7]|uniref:PfkB domain-containing protein n=2 Tax=Nitritalea TaxID=1187887 RepID=I5C956_9BACT|nr:PfkB domain-containing protein [Nitritalea halalkaliphila LW7]